MEGNDKFIDYMLDVSQMKNQPLLLVGVVYRDDDDNEEPEYVQATLIPEDNDRWHYFDGSMPELFLDGSIEMISTRAIKFTAHKDAGAWITRTIEFKSAARGFPHDYLRWLMDPADGSSDDDAEDLGELKDGDDFYW